MQDLLGGGAAAAATHPVRGVILGSALSLSLWVTLPSFFGRRVKGTNWELSHTVERVDWFVSHAWIDSGKDTVEFELCRNASRCPVRVQCGALDAPVGAVLCRES